jgi:Na+-transporting NADH:ubiquinone oxidoreductase subunit C
MVERESLARTLGVAGGVALVCSLAVSGAVHWLRPYQLAYRSIEENRAIVAVAGLEDGDAPLSDAEVVARYLELETWTVDLADGSHAPRAHDVDYRTALDDPTRSSALAPELDTAGLGRKPRYMPVYVLRDGTRIERIVLPVFGRGMWSTVYGFVSLRSDLVTVAAVRFYEHGETPGIGDRIQNGDWLASWAGKRAYDAAGGVALRVGSGTDGASSVDAITGATVTVSAIDRFVRFWLGPAGFGPFLAALRAEER